MSPGVQGYPGGNVHGGNVYDGIDGSCIARQTTIVPEPIGIGAPPVFLWGRSTGRQAQ